MVKVAQQVTSHLKLQHGLYLFEVATWYTIVFTKHNIIMNITISALYCHLYVLLIIILLHILTSMFILYDIILNRWQANRFSELDASRPIEILDRTSSCSNYMICHCTMCHIHVGLNVIFVFVISVWSVSADN